MPHEPNKADITTYSVHLKFRCWQNVRFTQNYDSLLALKLTVQLHTNPILLGYRSSSVQYHHVD